MGMKDHKQWLLETLINLFESIGTLSNKANQEL
jgi:hypothetical protein